MCRRAADQRQPMSNQSRDESPVSPVRLREATGDETAIEWQSRAAEQPGLSDTASHYSLEGEIARGGMGAILRGRDTDLGRDIALKVLLEVHQDKPDSVQRFIEEAQIAGQLQHPGI